MPAPPKTLAGDFLADVRRFMAQKAAVTWPSPRWRDDPAAFARDVLGICLPADQVRIIESRRDTRNTTVRSGHKCGKTTAIAVAAIWFYCAFDRARVLCTAVKASQVDQVIWAEIKRLVRRSRTPDASTSWTAPYPVTGTLNETARFGLVADDGRQIWGATARTGEGLAGISGPNILILADEASGIGDGFFEVLGTSLAGSGGVVRKAYISNPTRSVGEFYRSHTSNASLFHCIHISSEDTPNARGLALVPGLAGKEWIEERKREWGEDSPQYRIRVKGEFVLDAEGKILSLNAIAEAQLRWDESPDEGQLQLGIDPAGDGVIGDETAIALRRGSRIVQVPAWRGLSEDAIVAHALGMLREHRRSGDTTPRIAIDVEGGIGTRVGAKLRAHLDANPGAFVLVQVRGGKKMWGSPEYHLVRDALWGQFQKWIIAGGAIPDDIQLAQDLNAPTFTSDANRRYRATPKDVLRRELGRSPDRGDAACLAVWGHLSTTPSDEGDRPSTRESLGAYSNAAEDAYDIGDEPSGDCVYG